VKLAGLISVMAILVLPLGCEDSRSTVVAANPPPNASGPVVTPGATASEAEWLASGPLIVENQVDVGAEREGVVSAIFAEAGSPVKKGQILAQLDDRQLTANLEAASARTRSTAADLHNWEAEARVLDADLRRAEKMWDAGLITQEQIEHARYQAESDHWDVERVKQLQIDAEASERSLRLELEKTRVVAPFDGVVARRYVRVGQKVALGDRLFWVTAESPLRIRFTLPETFLGHIGKSQRFELTSPDVEGRRWSARVIEVSPVVDPSSGTIEVLCEVVGPASGLRPGMSASVRIPK
jgi:membrane fusion protein, multidrug efflux system